MTKISVIPDRQIHAPPAFAHFLFTVWWCQIGRAAASEADEAGTESALPRNTFANVSSSFTFRSEIATYDRSRYDHQIILKPFSVRQSNGTSS